MGGLKGNIVEGGSRIGDGVENGDCETVWVGEGRCKLADCNDGVVCDSIHSISSSVKRLQVFLGLFRLILL